MGLMAEVIFTSTTVPMSLCLKLKKKKKSHSTTHTRQARLQCRLIRNPSISIVALASFSAKINPRKQPTDNHIDILLAFHYSFSVCQFWLEPWSLWSGAEWSMACSGLIFFIYFFYLTITPSNVFLFIY